MRKVSESRLSVTKRSPHTLCRRLEAISTPRQEQFSHVARTITVTKAIEWAELFCRILPFIVQVWLNRRASLRGILQIALFNWLEVLKTVNKPTGIGTSVYLQRLQRLYTTYNVLYVVRKTREGPDFETLLLEVQLRAKVLYVLENARP